MAVQQLLTEDCLDPQLLKDRVLGHDPLHTSGGASRQRRTRCGGRNAEPRAQPEASEAAALDPLLAAEAHQPQRLGPTERLEPLSQAWPEE